MNIPTINPQFIKTEQTHRKRTLHQIDLRREHCIEDQRERISHLAFTMESQVCGKLLTHHRRCSKIYVEALHDGFPLLHSTGKASRLDHEE